MDKRSIFSSLDFGAYYAAELVPLSGEGTQRTGRCPFHDDHHESLTVNIGKGRFKCVECGAKGDLIDFHKKKYRVGFREALAQLAIRARLRPRLSQPDSVGDQNLDPIVYLNQMHFVVPIGGRTYIATEKRHPVSGNLKLELGNMADFVLMYKNRIVQKADKQVSIATLWVASPNRRQYEGIEFAPGQEIPGYYNLWKGNSVDPRKGNCSLFWQHLFFVICRSNRRQYRYIRRWLAHLMQRPAELPGVAIVIRGKQGTGKTLFADLVGSLLGHHYLMLTQMEQLTGRFTGHLKEALLVCANEAVWAGDKHGEGALKSLITDPMTPIEMKGKDLFSVRNYKRLIVTTNEQWAVPMAMDDRRFLVLEASDDRKEDKAYFAALTKQMSQVGLQALMHDLMREDLNGFDVRTKPQSAHGFNDKLQSAEPIVRWWFEKLYESPLVKTIDDLIDDTGWDREPGKTELYEKFNEFCRTHRTRTITKPVFGKQLHKMLPGCTIGETRPAGGIRSRSYIFPSLQHSREAFQRFAKEGPEIWE